MIPTNIPLQNGDQSTAMRHGPQSLSGIDIFNLETEQAVQHTKLMILHLWHDDNIRRIIKNLIDHLQVQAAKSILDSPKQTGRESDAVC
jgi:hypothetical protein